MKYSADQMKESYTQYKWRNYLRLRPVFILSLNLIELNFSSGLKRVCRHAIKIQQRRSFEQFWSTFRPRKSMWGINNVHTYLQYLVTLGNHQQQVLIYMVVARDFDILVIFSIFLDAIAPLDWGYEREGVRIISLLVHLQPFFDDIVSIRLLVLFVSEMSWLEFFMAGELF